MAAKQKEKAKRRRSWWWIGKRRWCSGAEEMNWSKNKLVWTKFHSDVSWTISAIHFNVMHDSATKKVLTISDCANVCFIAEDLLYCVWWIGKRRWCSGAEETILSKNQLVWKKILFRCWLNDFSAMHDSAIKKILAISDCTNVCFIAEDLLYCV